MTLETLRPICQSNIIYFEWHGDKILDGDFKCLADSKIQILDLNPCQFKMNELAELLAMFPKDLKGRISEISE